MAWFIFTTYSDPTDSDNYTLTSGSPFCNNGTRLCAIQASDNGNGHPVLDNSIRDEMLIALESQTPSTNVKLKNV